jgi:TrmH family RNA methyltransferase
MLDNPRSPRVRGVAKLRKRDARSETGLFLLEGPQAVSEALQWRPELLADLFVTPTALDRHPEIATMAADAGLEVEFVSEQVIETMADTVTPQGVVAVCKQLPRLGARSSRAGGGRRRPEAHRGARGGP